MASCLTLQMHVSESQATKEKLLRSSEFWSRADVGRTADSEGESTMDRQEMLARIREHKHPWDVAIVGGGATGVGVALDAASRGYDVVLVEQSDFGKGTSSRSTKLIHGGARYLKQGHLRLVREALRERSLLLRNAPHLVQVLPLLVPNYRWWEGVYHGLGFWAYDLLAGHHRFGRSRSLTRPGALTQIPTLKQDHLRGGSLLFDAQFDDARLLISMARTAADHGAVLLNHAPVFHLLKRESRIGGFLARDAEQGEELQITARAVINATGPFCDSIRQYSDPSAKPIIAPSQGTHLVLPRRFLPGSTALLVPRTQDGRILFAIPWLDHVIVGTTDVPLSDVPLEPHATSEEIEFILGTLGEYLECAPAREDVLSIFTGIRPLVLESGKSSGSTAKISRRHHVGIDSAGLITITGGKWTIWRRMAEDVVDQTIAAAGLARKRCVTHHLRLRGCPPHSQVSGPLSCYGTDAADVQALARQNPEWDRRLHPNLPWLAAEVIWAARHEMARTVEDVLARRTRALFLNVRSAIEIAPRVATLLAEELGHDDTWKTSQIEEFRRLAESKVLTTGTVPSS